MRKEFASHFNDEEILKLEMMPEISRWKKVLKFNEDEIEFLRMALFLNLTKKLNKDVNQSKNYIEKLQDVQNQNKFHLDTLVHFKNKLEGLRECDDVQCENSYLRDYLMLKEVLQKYFDEYRKVKAVIYTYFLYGFEKN